MKKLKIINNAFTLVEVLVSITIFWIMSISIIWIYIISTNITLKSDINRVMQENLKNVSSKISEDIRKNGILWISSSKWEDCNTTLWSKFYKKWDKLCIKWDEQSIYYLAKKDSLSWKYIRANPIDCEWFINHCVIAKWPNEPLTNSYVSIKELSFYLSTDSIPKVTMNIVLQPAIKKWVKPELIKNSKLIYQTTISERPF